MRDSAQGHVLQHVEAFLSRLATYEPTPRPRHRKSATPQHDVSENESKYHLLHCQLHTTDQNIKKVTSGPAAERLREK
jgi:intraflagellar transport protein 81